MSVLISGIKNYLNQFIRDTSTNSVTDSDRNRAITATIKELLNESGPDFTNKTWDFNYLDTIRYYDITTTVPDFCEPTDLRYTNETKNTVSYIRKCPRNIAVEINNYIEESFSLETKNRKRYLVIEHQSQYPYVLLQDTSSLTDNGTWLADTVNSDATNLSLDTVEYVENFGTASLKFDIDVSQSVNNKASLYNSTISAIDLSQHQDISSMLIWVYLPDITNITSVVSYWGSDTSNYWTNSATTDAYGDSFVDGWNRVKFDWTTATKVSSPDSSAITYLRFDINYGVGQTDLTNFRLSYVMMARPEKLTLLYQSWAVGIYHGVSGSSGESGYGNQITEFVSDYDEPFFSGIYDFYDKYVAHRAASILFRQMGLENDAITQENEAEKEKKRLRKKFPTSQLEQTKSFGVNLNWNQRSDLSTRIKKFNR